MRRALPFVVLVGACAPRPVPPPPVTPAPPLTVPSSAPPLEPSAAAAALPAVVDKAPILDVHFDADACTLETERWEGSRPSTELRLSRGGPAYAYFVAPYAKLSLLPGAASADAGLEAEDGGLMLRGYVARDAFMLQLSRPLVLGGFVAPTRYAQLSWSESKPEGVSVTYDPGSGIEPLSPLTATLACDAVTLLRGPFDAEEVVPNKAEGLDGLLRTNRPIALATAPGGKPVARLRARDDRDALVKVLQNEHGQALIAWSHNSCIVFGYVAASDLQRRRPPEGLGYGSGHGHVGLELKPDILRAVHCEHDVPVIASVAGARVNVGLIRAETRIEILENGKDEAAIQVRTRELGPALGARLLVKNAELARCTPE